MMIKPYSRSKVQVSAIEGYTCSQEDIDKVVACCTALVPIEQQGMRLSARIELAAALVSSALKDASEAPGARSIEEHLGTTKAVGELILLRAQEILAMAESDTSPLN
jgi:hypothetical protein